MHSEGIAFKPPSGEVGMCPRVGRMGPSKCIVSPGTERGRDAKAESTKGRGKPVDAKFSRRREALPTFRESDGNVSIIRSLVRAIALPDR